MTEVAVTPQKRSPRLSPWRWLHRNPVVLKELRARMRGKRAFALLTAYLGLLAIIVSIVYFTFISSSQPLGTVDQRQVFGKAVFGIVVAMEMLSISFIAPALTAGAIASEREHQTYDLLRTTLLPARSLVIGKFSSALLYILLLVLAAIPLQSLAFLFGGVAPEEVAIGTAILVVTAVTFCAVGMFFSSFIARTLVSTVLAYGFAILLVFGLPILFMIVFGLFNAAAGGFNGPPSPSTEFALLVGGWLLVCINPMATAIASEAILLDQQSVFLFTLPLSSGRNVTLLSPWIPYLGFYLLLSALLLWLSIRFVRRIEK